MHLLRAAAAVFARLGYHETTTNAIAREAGVSPATLYQFFPDKEAIANALAATYARQMADAERKLDPEYALSFDEAIHELVDLSIRFNREHPEFHTLVMDAPLSDAAGDEKRALGQVFIDFIAGRLRREQPQLSRLEASHHAQVALMIFRGVLSELVTATRSSRPRLQQAMYDAILRYLRPVVTQKRTPPRSRKKSPSAAEKSATRDQ